MASTCPYDPANKRTYSMKSYFCNIPRPQVELNRGSKDQRKNHGTEESANDRDGQRFQHFGAGADAEG